MDRCKRTCITFVCIFSFFAEGTVTTYIIRPLIGKIFKHKKTREGMNPRGYYHLTCGCLIIVYPSHRISKYCSHYRFSHIIGNYFIYISRFFIQRLIMLLASTGHMWISRWRVLPLLRQHIMHSKSTHCCSVPYFAT
ncbi:hypothetical protein E2986_13968 [Frieseomelitta varia]|uniref:Uncharacterized protein n=1 Tax=Frieseomelitta varia TaxID=561572 RepID=A0A833RMP3_9HYME|nr:hypothetical protein E2986_13968 [Frieseomelitta varia]